MRIVSWVGKVFSRKQGGKDEKFSVDKGKNPPTQPLRENVSDETYNSSHLKNICVLEKQKRARAKNSFVDKPSLGHTNVSALK